MKKFTAILATAFLIESLSVSNVFAERTSPRPWFSSRDGKTAVSPVKSERPSIQRRSKRAPRSSRVARRPSRHDKGTQIVQQAKKYEGTKYRFGGESPRKGFDCSGLVRRIYDDLNLKSLPRTSSQLYTMGQSIRMNDLRPGDLVFFKNTYKRGISHVGVYAGNNRFIHAQNSRRGVTMTKLSDPYYQLHYAGARRLY